MVDKNAAIAASDLTFTYKGRGRPSLSHVSLRIADRSLTGIMGGSGCGKSTLCLTFNGLIPHFIKGRLPTADELAWAVELLLDPEADLLHGSVLYLDAGGHRGIH